MKFSFAQDSRIGARSSNQDRLGFFRRGESLLLVLADGLGGHPRGELAAELAVAEFATAFRRQARPRLADPGAFLLGAFAGSHATIARRAQELGLADSPRTTAVACVVQDGTAHWSHVGDSRLYLVRSGRILARTRDHTPVQRLLDAGWVSEDTLASHPARNLLLQCLGGDPPPSPEPVASASLAKDDIVLLCSDGLWGALSTGQLLAGLLAEDLREAVRGLVELAEKRSGRESDNVSALALAWGEDAARPGGAARGSPFEGPPSAARGDGATEERLRRRSDAEAARAIEERTPTPRKRPASDEAER